MAHSKTEHSPAYGKHIILTVRWEKLVIIVEEMSGPVLLILAFGKTMPQGNVNKTQISQVHSFSVSSNTRNRNYVAATIRKP